LAAADSTTANSAGQPGQVGDTLILHSVQAEALLIIVVFISWVLTCHVAMPASNLCSPAAAVISSNDLNL